MTRASYVKTHQLVSFLHSHRIDHNGAISASAKPGLPTTWEMPGHIRSLVAPRLGGTSDRYYNTLQRLLRGALREHAPLFESGPWTNAANPSRRLQLLCGDTGLALEESHAERTASVSILNANDHGALSEARSFEGTYQRVVSVGAAVDSAKRESLYVNVRMSSSHTLFPSRQVGQIEIGASILYSAGESEPTSTMSFTFTERRADLLERLNRLAKAFAAASVPESWTLVGRDLSFHVSLYTTYAIIEGTRRYLSSGNWFGVVSEVTGAPVIDAVSLSANRVHGGLKYALNRPNTWSGSTITTPKPIAEIGPDDECEVSLCYSEKDQKIMGHLYAITDPERKFPHPY